MRPLRSFLDARMLGLMSLALTQPAVAQNQGFTIHRYHATPVGEWSASAFTTV